MAGGRPSKFNEETKRQLLFCASKGWDDLKSAKMLGIKRQTIANWKKNYPDFFASLKEAKQFSDNAVEQSLYDQACNGNITACIFWLKNRQPDRWRDKTEHDFTSPLVVEIINYGDKK